MSAVMHSNLIVAPSILSADLGQLSAEIADVERAGADWIHVDVMDGQFVPNITLGPVVLEAVRRATKLPLDVHLMIADPDRYIEAFARAGADWISVHVEACNHLQRCLSAIRQLGKRPGVVLNPHTPEEAIRYVLGDVDLVVVMSVNPGFGGQSFLPTVLPKVDAIRRWIERDRLPTLIEVDGGVAPNTVQQVVEAGAHVVVAGSAVFGKPNRKDAVHALREAAGKREVGQQ